MGCVIEIQTNSGHGQLHGCVVEIQTSLVMGSLMGCVIELQTSSGHRQLHGLCYYIEIQNFRDGRNLTVHSFFKERSMRTREVK